ncbi:TPA: hypothetical protein ACGSAW_000279 [Streptococcus pyogenes]|uniref:hypothetical protein n=1 Tax=Streptococcus TaxID=1301 RepID=UPI0008109C3F|nr:MULTISPECIES: hypothetical protein [Streptococcus]HEP3111947.1 hypothetical protein [Streptococcus pyogenes]MCW1061587.1 hypothetical protein [Streptococcus anginosus]OCM14633.1 hypothetical protein AX215_07435 [Streptococcus agalactiae]HEN4417482.1 hypothetical protein [Streptococcus agalactiae]HEO2148549.1 hypothetical protein [Streptococcus agalactiae]
MDTAVRVVIALGGVLAIIGLGWVLTGTFDYFAGRKNGNPQMMDQGMTSMISGGAIAAISAGVAAAIVAAMRAITF